MEKEPEALCSAPGESATSCKAVNGATRGAQNEVPSTDANDAPVSERVQAVGV